MKKVTRQFIVGFIGAIVFGAAIFLLVYSSLWLLSWSFNFDDEKTFMAVLYSFATIVVISVIAGAIEGVIYSRKFN